MCIYIYIYIHKHLKRHQKPIVFKYRVLIVIYFSHLFSKYGIYIYIYTVFALKSAPDAY